MKASKYNVTVNNGRSNILYNTFSRKYVLYSPEKKEYINNLLKDLNKERYEVEEADIIKKLIKAGIVVDDNLDELSKIKYYENKAKFQSDVFYIVIQATLDCNFRCVYCYEKHRNMKLDNCSMNSIIEFVKGVSKKVRTVYVAWFGGEPMLEFEKIKELTMQFQAICKESGCEYLAKMTTNGYLFTDERIEMLEPLAIRQMQITLDGIKETHDKKRPLESGEGTFDQVTSNLLKIIDKNVRVTLRINVDEENFNYISELFDMIPPEKRAKVNINICNVFQNEENLNLYDFYKTAVEKGYKFYNTTNSYAKCEGACKNSFTIQPDCRITPCSVCGEHGFYYGRINEKGETLITNKSEYYKFHSKSALDSDRCKQCIELPMCMGGCTCARYKDTNFCSREHTHEMNLDQVIKLHYYSDLAHNQLKDVNLI